MLTRIAVALTALYLVSNHAGSSGDPRDLVATAGPEASRSALAYCLDNPEPCRKLIGTVAGGKAESVAKTESLAKPAETPKAVPSSARAAELPPSGAIATEAYPLPPRRPSAKRA